MFAARWFSVSAAIGVTLTGLGLSHPRHQAALVAHCGLVYAFGLLDASNVT
jgi:hypothetical protein